MKTKIYLLLPLIICLTMVSQQTKAQHTDICSCEAEYVPGDKTTKIKAINPFTNKEETFVVEERDGYYIWQGDIILGKIGEDVSRNIFQNSNFWTNNTIPYVIASGFSSTMINRINSAASTITSQTNLNVIARTTETIYVQVNPGSGCSSGIGMPSSGIRNITLSTGCSFGSTMHEFLHSAGIHHEQTREDRDTYVSINFGNIQAGREHNFFKNDVGWSDHGTYDYGSIMHYGAYAFAINTSIKTITTLGGQTIGQRTALSASDIATVNRMYPLCTASTLTYNSTNIQPGRYKTSGAMNVGGDIPASTWALMSAGTQLTLTVGSSIKSGTDGKVELVLDGCNID